MDKDIKAELANDIYLELPYRHFKGGRYRPLMGALNSENRDEELVIYVSLDHGTVWARPMKMWLEQTDRWPDGKTRSRFVPETDEIRALFQGK